MRPAVAGGCSSSRSGVGGKEEGLYQNPFGAVAFSWGGFIWTMHAGARAHKSMGNCAAAGDAVPEGCR
jgi:hypothetical protein